jgi:hypothetical protein
MKEERDYIVQALKDAGVHGKIHESMKSLKNCSETHVGAVLRTGERFVRSGSKKRFTDQEGQRKQRNRLFERTTELHVVIADSSEEMVEDILTSFLKIIGKGLEIDGNWTGIEIGEADWVEGDDSILKSKIAVEFDVTLTGGIYTDTEVAAARFGGVKTNVNTGGNAVGRE